MIPGLPNEIAVEILKHLNMLEWIPLESVSRLWYNARIQIWQSITDLNLINTDHVNFKKILPYVKHHVMLDNCSSIVLQDPNITSINCSYSHYTYDNIFKMVNPERITRLEIIDFSDSNIQKIINVFPNLKTLILDHGEFDGSKITALNNLKHLRNLYIYSESHNSIWDFSNLKLEQLVYSEFWFVVFTSDKNITVTPVHTENTILLPSNPELKKIMLSIWHCSNDLSDHIIDIKPNYISLEIEFASDDQKNLLRNLLKQNNINSTVL